MRLFLLVFTALTLFATGAVADEKDVIDTGKGLTFQKPSGWTKSANRKGCVALLSAAGDPNAQIEFRWAKIEPKKAKQYFNSFHSSLAASLERAGAPQQKTYGKLSGVLTEYKTSEGEGSVVVFQSSQGDAAWLVVGMFTQESRDSHLRDLEKLLGTVVVAKAP